MLVVTPWSHRAAGGRRRSPTKGAPPDGQVVAEPVDVDGRAAILFLPDGQADGHPGAGM